VSRAHFDDGRVLVALEIGWFSAGSRAVNSLA